MKSQNNNIAVKLYNKKTVARIETKINLLGLSSNYETIRFLNMRFFSTVVVFIMVLAFLDYGHIIAPITSVLYYYFYEKVLLDDKIKKRTQKLDSEAIYFFEVLTLSLQTGRNLIEAVTITVNSIDSELSSEFKEAIRQVKYGKSLTESLSDIQKNIPSDNINNIILTLTQANVYGSSIIDTMYTQVDYLREKRKLEVKATISKIPTKISIISVFFFIPLILIIILAPAILSYLG